LINRVVQSSVGVDVLLGSDHEPGMGRSLQAMQDIAQVYKMYEGYRTVSRSQPAILNIVK
jgi:hypothetical protein